MGNSHACCPQERCPSITQPQGGLVSPFLAALPPSLTCFPLVSCPRSSGWRGRTGELVAGSGRSTQDHLEAAVFLGFARRAGSPLEPAQPLPGPVVWRPDDSASHLVWGLSGGSAGQSVSKPWTWVGSIVAPPVTAVCPWTRSLTSLSLSSHCDGRGDNTCRTCPRTKRDGE